MVNTTSASHTSFCAENPSLQIEKCREGFFCKPRYFPSGGDCLPNCECRCIYGSYHEILESFYPDEHCQQPCACVGHNKVQCADHTCPSGTKYIIKDGRRACHGLQHFMCTVMGSRRFVTYDRHHFDFNVGRCLYVLSQMCEEGYSISTVVIHLGQLYLRVYGVIVTIRTEAVRKVKVNFDIYQH